MPSLPRRLGTASRFFISIYCVHLYIHAFLSRAILLRVFLPRINTLAMRLYADFLSAAIFFFLFRATPLLLQMLPLLVRCGHSRELLESRARQQLRLVVPRQHAQRYSKLSLGQVAGEQRHLLPLLGLAQRERVRVEHCVCGACARVCIFSRVDCGWGRVCVSVRTRVCACANLCSLYFSCCCCC